MTTRRPLAQATPQEPTRTLSANLRNMGFMNRNAKPPTTAAAAAANALQSANATATTTTATTTANEDAATAGGEDEVQWVVADLVHFGHVRAKHSIQTQSNLLSPIASASAAAYSGRRSIGVKPAAAAVSLSTVVPVAGKKRAARDESDSDGDSSSDEVDERPARPAKAKAPMPRSRSISSQPAARGRR